VTAGSTIQPSGWRVGDPRSKDEMGFEK